MKVKVTKIGQGAHPSEVIVAVTTTTGSEKLVVHARSIQDNGLDIGYPINRDNNNLLVELPRETISGAWRIWVPEGAVVE
ncbi:hypothetical protein HLI18_12620 [Rhizobium laguerreae]|uniref:hypothetical protein n=1 Tax=Rhizobium TaxID=379 RepID=UPI001478BED9|nr:MULTISPECIES: hypothetical protein [Rhizobium]MBY5520930.1 hypothetical protein [Rhizobium leguminosarum]NNG70750.1 hypothetical protein [Rhizobium laguerreae]